VGEAVAALKATFKGEAAPPPVPPMPSVDLPVSAHVPESYIADIHDRLAVYQRVASIEDAAGVALMQEELRDRFGPLPLAVEHLLYVSLARSVARRAGVESIKTDDEMFHIRVRRGTTPAMRATVEGLGLDGILVGPNQVRIDRVSHSKDWMAVLVRVLRAMANAVETEAPASAAG
jgi:transcription-repair coupling factor (superfamily II helicase)